MFLVRKDNVRVEMCGKGGAVHDAAFIAKPYTEN